MRRSDQRRLAVFALYQNDLTGRALDELFERDSTAFTRALAEDTLTGRDAIDEVIGEYARNWSIQRIAPLERSILRVAVHELNAGEEPREVVVNEAVELAKRYCSADAPKFVNGILGSILRDLPEAPDPPEKPENE